MSQLRSRCVKCVIFDVSMVKANNHEEVDESKFGEQLFEVLKNECQCDM